MSHEPKRRRRIPGWVSGFVRILAGVLGLVSFPLAVVAISIGQAGTVDRFRFLSGHAPLETGVLPHPHSGTFQEHRIYSWKQEFNLLQSMAARELRAEGFKLVEKSGSHAYWTRRDGTTVWLQAGRSRSAKEAITGLEIPHKLDWVTVIVDGNAPDHWTSHVRLALTPDPY